MFLPTCAWYSTTMNTRLISVPNSLILVSYSNIHDSNKGSMEDNAFGKMKTNDDKYTLSAIF
jgi:hypothetical protein